MKRPRLWIMVMVAVLVLLAALVLVQPAVAPHVPQPTHTPEEGRVDGAIIAGTITLEEGRCCAGGTAGETIQIHALLTVTEGDSAAMRAEPVSSCAPDQLVLSAPFEPYQQEKTFDALLANNWVGFYVAAQFKNADGILSPIVCDEVSLEGMPAQAP